MSATDGLVVVPEDTPLDMDTIQSQPQPQQLSQTPQTPQQQQSQPYQHSLDFEHQERQPHPQTPQQQYQHGDLSAIKLTRGTSCVLCQQRKVRCDKNKPCANCVKAGVDCRIVPPQPPRRRKKRLQEKDLIDRIRKYEGMLSDHGVKFDAISQDLRAESHQLDDVDELENDFEGLKTTPTASVGSPSTASVAEGRRGNSKKMFSLHKEFRASESLLQDSSEDELDGSTIHHAFDRMFSAQDGFPFIVGGRYASVTNVHPSTIHIFQLWQIYIDNINILLKVTHIPTIQPQFIEAASRLDKAPKNIEALMFGIYIMAITSLEPAEVQARFFENKVDMLGRYFAAMQQALINADFMRNNDPITLQAFLLYLFAIRWFVDPRQVFCLIGIVVRIAQRMGLHRDPGEFGLPPFETEQRRRLWWTIVGYDRRIGEMTGSTVTALSSGGDCRPPLNVNDSDLHIDAKDMPAPHAGPTEMLFALTRIELSMAVASNSNRDSFKMNNTDKSNASSPATNGGSRTVPATIRLAGQDGPSYTLDGFCAHIEGTYLQYCDPKIPLHFFTLTMTRQALCKMRVLGFLVRMNDADSMPLQEIERENLFLQATQMIEYDNVVQSSESLQPFKWYSMHFFPFPAYMFLIQELRQRIMGPMTERAWEAISRNHDLRGLLNNMHSPMHLAFGRFFIKAWDAHETAMRAADKHLVQPRFIKVLTERADKRRLARAENRQDPALEQGPVDFPNGQESANGSGSRAPPLMTPTEGIPRSGALSGGTPQAADNQAEPVTDPDDEMDWSYMMSSMGGNHFPTFGNLGPFNNGVPRMGAPISQTRGGGGGQGNMFGS